EGKVIYEDRTLAETKPMLWRHINVAMTTDPTRNPLYDFSFTLGGGKVLDALATGRFDIDDLDVWLKSSRVRILSDPNLPNSPAPPEIQQILQQYDLRGEVIVEAAG